MAISHIASTGAAGANNDIPAGYQIGDLIIVFASRSDGSDPGMGAGVGFQELATGGFANLRWKIGWKYAEANSGLTTGTWTGTDRMSIHVYRDAALHPSNFANQGSTSGALVYPAFTAAANSWMLAFVTTSNTDNTGTQTPPTGFTLRTGAASGGIRVASHDSNGIKTTYAGENVAKLGTNGGWRTLIVELTELGPDGVLNWTEGNTVSTTKLSKDKLVDAVVRFDNFTVSGTAYREVEGSLNWSESEVTLTSSSELGRIGTLNWTEADTTSQTQLLRDLSVDAVVRFHNLTLDGEADVIVSGTLNWTEGATTLSAFSGENRVGALIWTEEDTIIDGEIVGERTGTLNWEEFNTTVSGALGVIIDGTLDWTEEDTYIVSGFDPDETPRRPDECRPIEEMIEEEIDKVLTQYREAPNLLFVIRNGLNAAAQAWDHLCDISEYFDLNTAVGDQLTLIGKRMGFPRCHCICEPPAFFGFKCGNDDGNPLGRTVGFCETGVWAECGISGVTEVCINDDEIYRKFLFVRSYQMLQRYDYESLKVSVQIMWGDKARVISYGDGQVVLAPFRPLLETEKRLIKLIPRIMPVALGIQVRIHFGTYPLIAGFGEGWSGFCEEIPGEIIYTDTNGDRYINTENGVEYLAADEFTRDAYWLCPIDVKPYSC